MGWFRWPDMQFEAGRLGIRRSGPYMFGHFNPRLVECKGLLTAPKQHANRESLSDSDPFAQASRSC